MTRIKRISKRSISTVLAVLLIFSTLFVGTITTANADSWFNTGGSDGTATIYYDNSLTQWSAVSFKIGRQYNYGSDNPGYTLYHMTKVTGTDNIYKCTVAYAKYVAFCITNFDCSAYTNYNEYSSSSSGTDKTVYTNNGHYTAATEYKKFSLGNRTYFFVGQDSTVGTTSSPHFVSCLGASGSGSDGDTTYSNYTTYQKSVSVSSVANGTLTASYTDDGGTAHTISEGNSQTLLIGKTITVSASPSSGYATDSISVSYAGNASSVTLSSGQSTFTSGNTATTVSCVFSLLPNEITVAAGSGGTVASTPILVSNVAKTIPTATPNYGYKFVNWTATTGITITNPTSASAATVTATQSGTVTANFAKDDSLNLYMAGRFNVQSGYNNSDWIKTDENNYGWNATCTWDGLKFSWNSTNQRYELNTWASVYDLSAQLSGNNPWFMVYDSAGKWHYNKAASETTLKDSNKTITLSRSDSDPTSYHERVRFSGTETTQPVILYFDATNGNFGYYYPTYTVTKTDDGHATITTYSDSGRTSSASSFTGVKTVYYRVTLDSGYRINTLTANGQSVSLSTNAKYTTYNGSFTITGNASISVTTRQYHNVTVDKSDTDVTRYTVSGASYTSASKTFKIDHGTSFSITNVVIPAGYQETTTDSKTIASVTADATITLTAEKINYHYEANFAATYAAGPAVVVRINGADGTPGTTTMKVGDTVSAVVSGYQALGYTLSNISFTVLNGSTIANITSSSHTITSGGVPASSSGKFAVVVTFVATTPAITGIANATLDNGVYKIDTTAGEPVIVTPSASPAGGTLSYTFAGTDSGKVSNAAGVYTFTTPENLGLANYSGTKTYTFTVRPTNQPTGVNAVNGSTVTVQVTASYSATQQAYFDLFNTLTDYSTVEASDCVGDSLPSAYSTARSTAMSLSFPAYNATNTSDYEDAETGLITEFNAINFKTTTLYVLSSSSSTHDLRATTYDKIFKIKNNPTITSYAQMTMTPSASTSVGCVHKITYYGKATAFKIMQSSTEKTNSLQNYTYGTWYIDAYTSKPSSASAYVPVSVTTSATATAQLYTAQVHNTFNLNSIITSTSGSFVSSGATVTKIFEIRNTSNQSAAPIVTLNSNSDSIDSYAFDSGTYSEGTYYITTKVHAATVYLASGPFEQYTSATVTAVTLSTSVQIMSTEITYYVDMHKTVASAPLITITGFIADEKSAITDSHLPSNESLIDFPETIEQELSLVEGSQGIYSYTIDTPFIYDPQLDQIVTGVNATATYGTINSTFTIPKGNIEDGEVWLDAETKGKTELIRTNTQPANNIAVASGKKRIYLKSDSEMSETNWAKPYIYSWDDDDAHPDWTDTAVAMKYLGADSSGNKYYYGDILSTRQYVIFQGRTSAGETSGEQTADITLEGRNFFEMTENSSNSQNHNITALDNAVVPTVTSAPTIVSAPLKDNEDRYSVFSVAPSTYTGDLEYSSNKGSVATVDSSGRVTAVSDGTATITVKVKGTVDGLLSSKSAINRDYFSYSVSVTINDANVVNGISLLSYESKTAVYGIEGYGSGSTHAIFANAPVTTLTITRAGSPRSYSSAGIVTQTASRTSPLQGDGATAYTVKYAVTSSSCTIDLKIKVKTRADTHGSGMRYGFFSWNEATSPDVTEHTNSDPTFKSTVEDDYYYAEMTLTHNGHNYTAVYNDYEYIDAVVTYHYYDYNTVRDGKDNYIYYADWAHEPASPSTTNPKTYYDSTEDYQTSHVLKTYTTDVVEYRSDNNNGHTDLNNKDFRTIFVGSSYRAQAAAISAKNLKNFKSNYYNFIPYYGENNSAIDVSYDPETFRVTLDVYLYNTLRTYTVSVNGTPEANQYTYQQTAHLTNGSAVDWKIDGTVVSSNSTGYSFRVLGDTVLTTEAASASLTGKSVITHSNYELVTNNNTQKLHQNFLIEDFIDKGYYYNDPNDNNNEKIYDEISFVGGGVAYYSYSDSGSSLNYEALSDLGYVDSDTLEAETYEADRDDLYNDSTGNYGVAVDKTYIGDRIQELIEKNKTNSLDDEIDLYNAYATEIELKHDVDDLDDNTGLIYRYLPYNSLVFDEEGDPVLDEHGNYTYTTRDDIYHYSSDLQAYMYIFCAVMNNKSASSDKMMRAYSYMVFSYRDHTFTDNPDGEVKYILVLSERYADASTYEAS